MSAAGLRVEGLSVTFEGTAVVQDVDLTLAPGSVLAVLGPSGCGKSTLLRTVAGLERPAAGRVLLEGRDLARVPTHRRGFALMFQDGQLFEHLDVAGNVGYPLRLRRTGRAERRRRTAELLDLVGLGGYAARSPATLSGGERQRVALARALAVEPRLLLLDEPLSALDRGLRERLAADLHDILRAAGVTAVLVTHDQEEAFAVADTMAVMREGRLVQQGSLAEVWAHPVDGWTARFLGYAEVLDGDRARTFRRLVAPEASWEAVALRRSALRLDPAGSLEATVEEARLTPELVRLRLDVDGLGVLPGVASPAAVVRAGERVRVSLDPARTAPLPGPA
ncbi:ABC transporter ATP-binding protein [Nocardioides aurantiacus]|uniref:ABC-type quaternary amine transporter n=1 Tax=Nocardioides aurantiacus TaxID=86796 RepID=A0A3N2CQ22_9ACTN|nr:ABC transporter ATP-binding protein [Nocardioides aurantiacus]ROR89424.1 thiamine transport system ATP-binding protein [Nocardioides aurantiacus]